MKLLPTLSLLALMAVGSASAAWPSWETQQRRVQEWLPHFEAAAQKHSLPVELLIGISSVETGVRTLSSDHGLGVMQVSAADAPSWAKTKDWRDPAKAIMKGAEILAAKRDQIKALEGKETRVRSSRNGKSYRFTGAKIASDADLWRITAAAYNAGLWAYYGYSKNANPDRFTDGGDYSAQVTAKSQAWASAVKGTQPQKPAPAAETKKPAAQPQKPVAKPVTKPLAPVAQPKKPEVKPETPKVKESVTKPMAAVAKPAPSMAKPAAPVAQPQKPAAKPEAAKPVKPAKQKPSSNQEPVEPKEHAAKGPKAAKPAAAKPEGNRTTWVDLRAPWEAMHEALAAKAVKE
jgi:hypothetical protein